jgi:hypothetical protein
MTRATILVDTPGEPPEVHAGVIAYVLIDDTGHLDVHHAGNANPRVIAHALAYAIRDLIDEADDRHVPPLNPAHYPRHPSEERQGPPD